MPGAYRRGRPCTASIDNIKTWTGLTIEESIRVAEDRGEWRKYTFMVWPTLGIEDGYMEQNRTVRMYNGTLFFTNYL